MIASFHSELGMTGTKRRSCFDTGTDTDTEVVTGATIAVAVIVIVIVIVAEDKL